LVLVFPVPRTDGDAAWR